MSQMPPAKGAMASGQQTHFLAEQTAGLLDKITKLDAKLKQLEAKLGNMPETTEGIVKTMIGEAYVGDATDLKLDGLQLALVVSTDDPLKMGRIRYWHPMIHNEIDPVLSLDWAYPISTLGGFDDSGATWVPPAGSTCCLMFHNGNKEQAYYMGTTWNRSRGTGIPTFPHPVPEFQTFWQDRGSGYLLGPQDGTQVYMPFNTEIYNGKDINDTSSYYTSDEFSYETIPTGYGIKTPEKAYLKFYDGNRKCNLKWKRTELVSSRGNIILMKDDHLHPAGQWASNKLGGGADGSRCGKWITNARPAYTTEEKPECCICGDLYCKGGPLCPADPGAGQRFANPWSKRYEESRPYAGPQTAHNPQIDMPQTGIWIQSIGGARWWADDSVEQPDGKPTWDLPYGTGCTDLIRGRTLWGSMTGHICEMSDIEDETGNRGEDNFVRFCSAGGNMIELNDHTISKTYAGARRGIKALSTSGHILFMCDQDNEHVPPERTNFGGPSKGLAAPKPKAKNAYVLLASGYGTKLLFKDDHSQEDTETQVAKLETPHRKDQRKTHFFQQQMNGDSEGAVMMRSGGVYVETTRASDIEIVGDDDFEADANKVVKVKDNHIHVAKKVYFNQNDITFFKAKQYIFLGAGEDCESAGGEPGPGATGTPATGGIYSSLPSDQLPATNKGPCFFPVIVAKQPWRCPITSYIHFGLGWGTNNISDRVFASASKG